MNPIVFWVAALVAVTVLSPVLRLLVAAVAGKQIGANALAKQPDAIHLERATPQAWNKAATVRSVLDPLVARGFADAGVYTAREMPGLVIELLASARDNFYAAVYEHPRAGVWLELFSRFQDGTSVTYSTARPHGIAPRPGHPCTHLPGLPSLQLLERALAQRPKQPLETAYPDQAVSLFENAYAESIAYRKGVGVSRGEVVKTAMRRAA